MRLEGFWRLAQQHSERVALISNREVVTAGVLFERVNSLSHGLRSIGLQRGDAVAVRLDNEPAALELYLAALQSGLYYVPVGMNCDADACARVLALSGPQAFVASPRSVELLARSRGIAHLNSDKVFTTGPVAGFRGYEELIGGHPGHLPSDRHAGRTAVVDARSGYVSRPKLGGSPDAIAAAQARFTLTFDLTPGGVHLAACPLSHPVPLKFAVSALQGGHAIVLLERWNATTALELIGTHGVTNTFFVPSMLEALMALPEQIRSAADVTSLESIVVGMSRCPSAVREQAERWLDGVVCEYYRVDGGRLHVEKPRQVRAASGTRRLRRLGFWGYAHHEGSASVLVQPGGAEVSAADLCARANQLSHALSELGLKEGDAAAILLDNSAEFLEAYLATMQSGFVFVPLDPRAPESDLSSALRHSQAKVVIAGRRNAQAVDAACELASIPVERRIVIEPDPGGLGLESVRSRFGTDPPANCPPGQLLAHTSGTTGPAKGVRRPDYGATAQLRGVLDSVATWYFDMKPGGVHLVAAPLWQGAPLSVALAALHSGQTLVLMDRWLPVKALRLIEEYRVTSTFMVPTMLIGLLSVDHGLRQHSDTSSLVSLVHGAEPCPTDVKRRLLGWLGEVIYEYYATVEAAGTFVDPHEWKARPGTVGRPFPGVDVRVLDGGGIECPPGSVGQVYLSDSGFEYIGSSDGTRGFDGYITLGDFGYMDTEGWLYLVGRRSDIINVGGMKVHPKEVENILCGHAAVRDVAAIGSPDARYGEVVKALVELAPGYEADDRLELDLLRLCRSRLPRLKAPRRIEFVARLEREGAGKPADEALNSAQPSPLFRER